jgi:hypothetical protein
MADIPLGRMAQPSELQGTIVWMASNASSYLNGSDVVGISVLLVIECLVVADHRWRIHLLVNGRGHDGGACASNKVDGLGKLDLPPKVSFDPYVHTNLSTLCDW